MCQKPEIFLPIVKCDCRYTDTQQFSSERACRRGPCGPLRLLCCPTLQEPFEKAETPRDG